MGIITRNGEFPSGASIGMAVTKDMENYITFETEEPTYPNLGNIYEGDYYKGIPYGEYIDKLQELPRKSAEKPVFDIRDFGAVDMPGRVNTAAFQAAADACRDAGGGVILVRDGHYVTGTFYLHDDTTLFVAPDASIEATRESGRLKTAVLVAEEAKNLVITGGGTICGNGEWFVYEPKLKPALLLSDRPHPASHLAPRGTTDQMLPETSLRYNYRRRIRFSEDKYNENIGATLRPEFMVYLKGCRNVRIENIILKDAMAWTLNLFVCEDVLVKDIIIDNNRHVANTDGIDITGSSRVEIAHCFISTADDGIVVKNPENTGTDMSRIHVHDCQVITVMNSFKIGTETRWDISDILVERCRFFMPDIFPGTTSGIAIESADGGHIKDVTVRDIEMQHVTCPIFICLNMRNKYQVPGSDDVDSPYWGGRIQNILIERITAEDMEVPCILSGFVAAGVNGGKVRKGIENITIRGFKAVYLDNEEIVDVPETIEEYLYGYPENNLFGDVDAYGIWVRHCDKLVLEEVEIIPRSVNTRDMIKLYDVQ